MRDKLTYEDQRKDFFKNDRAMVGLLITVSVSLLVVTALGIIGLASFWVQQRSKQIGIRRALGATRGQILRYFQTENFLLASLGIVLGMLAAYAINLALMNLYELPRMPLYYLPLARCCCGCWARSRCSGRPGARQRSRPQLPRGAREMRACRMLLMALLPLPALAGGGSSQTLEWRRDDARRRCARPRARYGWKPRVRKPASACAAATASCARTIRLCGASSILPMRCGIPVPRLRTCCCAATNASSPSRWTPPRGGWRWSLRHRRHRRHPRGAETSPPSSPRLWLCLMGGAGLSRRMDTNTAPSAPPIPFCRTA